MSEVKKNKATEILEELRSLTASLRRQPAARPEEDDIDPTDKRSLAGRLSVVTHQRAAAEEAAAKALRLAEDLRLEHAAELAALRADAAKSVTDGVRRVEQGYALRAAMIEPDDDGVTAAHRLYDSLPENKRPDNIVEWWKGLTPEAAPKTLRAYLAAPAAAEEAKGTTVRQPPKVDVGRGKATEPDPATMDAAAYAAYLDSFASQRAAERFQG